MKQLVLALAMLAAPLMAQPSSPTAQIDAIKKLAFLEGEWKGEGWMDFGGQKQTMSITEKAETRLSGVVLVVEGLGEVTIPGQEKPMRVHEALGVISYDPGSKGYKMRSWLANGMTKEFDVKLENGKIIWGYEQPPMGHVRYTIQLNDKGQWFEIGERSADGKTWTQFFEMALTRT